ncbi:MULTISPECIES: amidohydrolase family protein [Flavobacteriaceae]|uniref:amidohydrolase family protein n=1 Tax=Flavobacteriaceae TaxID=49546 RepID=UPI001490A0B6|nr:MULTISPECIES: amidohydrolase family protein [Allomuricauda]MDC6367519.1 amidohydrolase family protein [Muricauda sp. AC10]
MKIISYIFLVGVLISVSCKPNKSYIQKKAIENPNSLSIKLVNGKWFNGSTFESKTVWVKNGILNFTNENTENDTIIDLKGKYVIPPFGEAHNHNLESDYKLNERINAYLNNGVFYVKHLSSIKIRIDPLIHHYNKPDGIDVSLAHAPLTATGGHPVALRKRFLEYGRFEGLFNTLEEIESHGYFIIDNDMDLENKWEEIVSFKPDFIKINLLYSEEYEKRKNDTTYFGNKGLNPELIPNIVKKAHEHNLRVSAHIETSYDFHIAIKAGVDEIAHLPGFDDEQLIKVEDAVLAKKKGVVVVPTASLITKRKDKPNYKDLFSNMSTNLKLLKENGVTLAIGSDMYNDNSVEEFQLLNSLHIFSKLELLKMWCENSAMTTFPNRKIGLLKEGFEASFLVLNNNPLDNIKDINQSIVIKVKQGTILD